jgi:hypothetical protein
MVPQKVVTPVKTGIQMVCNCLKRLDSGFRLSVRRTQTGRNDGKRYFETFYEIVDIETVTFYGEKFL